MNQTPTSGKRPLLLYRILTLALVAAAVLLRTLNLLLFYEKEIDYYAATTPTPVILNVLVALSVLLFAVYPLVALRHEDTVPTPQSPFALVGALIAAVALAAFTVSIFSEGAAGNATPFATVLTVTAIVSVLYFLLLGLGKTTPPLAFITGVGVILCLGALMFESYLDMTVQMNAVTKLSGHLGCIGGLVLMLSEIRLVCGFPKPRFDAFLLSVGTLFLGTASIPSIVAGLLGRMPERDHPLSDLVLLALFLLALLRLLSPRVACEEPQTPPAAPENSDAAPEKPSQP